MWFSLMMMNNLPSFQPATSNLHLIWPLSVLMQSINRIPQLKVDIGGRAQTYSERYNAMQYTEAPSQGRAKQKGTVC